MGKEAKKFTFLFADGLTESKSVEKDGILIGRLGTCDLVLDHTMVSRVHAGINFDHSDYELVNLSKKNTLMLNGSSLGPQKTDVLADGDTIQVGPFSISVSIKKDSISLMVQGRFTTPLPEEPAATKPPVKQARSGDAAGVLGAFWGKRNRSKEDWGTRLRPTEEPIPGKAMFNWRPTKDLRRPWRFGLFIWAFLLVGAIGAFAYFRYPTVYEPKPLSNPHASKIENSAIAVTANGNSCTTCHTLNQPIENSCIRCHGAEGFHASNTKAHEEAGITCTVCHKEHQGSDFQITGTAIQSCAQCHNDSNKATYNGKTVHTAHGGSYGYPVVDGVWKWKGLYREVADAIPEISSSATSDKDEQARLSRYFHTIHVARLKAAEGVKGDSRGLVTCSSCHKSFDPIDRTTPRQTCAACHTTSPDASGRDTRFGTNSANCISCHVQHPYSADRWKEFLTDDALNRRRDAVVNNIKKLHGQ